MRLGFADGATVDLHGCADDGVARSVHGFQIVAYDIPPGCAAAYFPEAQALAPAGLRAKHARTPAFKEIPIFLTPSTRPASADF